MPKTAVGLMAKQPELGFVKTRLAKKIGNEKALELYEALLDNAIGSLCDLDADTFLRTAFVTPADKCESFSKRYVSLDQYHPQEGNDLGNRMQRALEKLLEIESVDRAILIGADIPGISGTIISQAATLLDDNDLVIGPTFDGGYYLIGIRKMYRSLFNNIRWGTEEVLARTLEEAKANRLKVGQLEKLHDVDELSDLKYFPHLAQIIK